jgi:hypothetical protein
MPEDMLNESAVLTEPPKIDMSSPEDKAPEKEYVIRFKGPILNTIEEITGKLKPKFSENTQSTVAFALELLNLAKNKNIKFIDPVTNTFTEIYPWKD